MLLRSDSYNQSIYIWMDIWKTQPLKVLSVLSNLPVKELQSLHHEHNLNVPHFSHAAASLMAKCMQLSKKYYPGKLG